MKEVLGFEGLYWVTEEGSVWSSPKPRPFYPAVGTKKNSGQWLLPAVNLSSKGKITGLKVSLYKNAERYIRLIHRLVAEAYLDNTDGLPFVNHIDGDPTNNNLCNLEWCNASQNSKHAFQNGLVSLPNCRGEANGRACLTEEEVKEVRNLYLSMNNKSAVARKLGLAPKTVSDIILGKTWSHVD